MHDLYQFYRSTGSGTHLGLFIFGFVMVLTAGDVLIAITRIFIRK